MLNVIICEDELPILNQISLLFEKAAMKNDIDLNIVLRCTDYESLLSYMSSNSVNLVVLDIEFKNYNLTGLDVAREIRKFNKNCYIIFITSHFEHVMEAYKLKTFDYLFKSSISVDLISNTLLRLVDDMSNTSRKFLKIDNKGTFIDLNDIFFIEKRGMKLIYHTSQSEYETYNSFTRLENKLPENFVRCHKSFVANINKISDISLSNASITFSNGTNCFIGPKFKNNFMEVINYDAITK